VCHGLVKRRSPHELVRMARGDSDLDGGGRVGAVFSFGGKVSASALLTMVGGSRGEPQRRIASLGEVVQPLCVGRLGPQCAKRKLCLASPVPTTSTPCRLPC
jgi:hypothetical protein